MTPFKLTDELLSEIEQLIDTRQNQTLHSMMEDYHYADIAEVIDELDEDQATYLINLLDSEKTSDVLTELDEDIREAILKNLSSKEIAVSSFTLTTALRHCTSASGKLSNMAACALAAR